jgi:glycosyltransferase involved in cell wall biosynthesis
MTAVIGLHVTSYSLPVTLKIALVHDFLTQHGGAERVLAAFRTIWPDAPVYTIVYDKKQLKEFETADIRPSFLQMVPFGVRRYKWFLPWMPTAIERHNLMNYDVVLSSSSAFAKGVITGPDTLHICYCHTPTRYLWTDTHSYVADLGYGDFVKRALPFLFTNLRLWDQMTASRVDHYIANSENVRRRIFKYYDRESDVIHPPIDTQRFVRQHDVERAPYYLAGGRLVAYKRFDLLVDAFNRLGIPLRIFGTGPEGGRMRRRAKSNIQFLGHVADDALPALYHRAQAFLHPQEEDFGLTALEAMAAGCPVIAYDAGGARETVVRGVTGTFFEEQSWESVADAVLHHDARQYDPVVLARHTSQFDINIFRNQISASVAHHWLRFQNKSESIDALTRYSLPVTRYQRAHRN